VVEMVHDGLVSFCLQKAFFFFSISCYLDTSLSVILAIFLTSALDAQTKCPQVNVVISKNARTYLGDDREVKKK
jgi:hypothetical protein